MHAARRAVPALTSLVLIAGLGPWPALPARAEPQLTEASSQIDGAFDPQREPLASKLERLSYTYGVELAPDADTEGRTGAHRPPNSGSLIGDKHATLDGYAVAEAAAGVALRPGTTPTPAHWRTPSAVWAGSTRAGQPPAAVAYYDPRISESGIAVAIRAVAGGINWLISSIKSAKASMSGIAVGAQASLPHRGFYSSASFIAVVAGLGIQGLIAVFMVRRGKSVRRRG